VISVNIEDDFLIVKYIDWDVSDLGRFCDEFYQALDQSPIKLFGIHVALTNPRRPNLLEAIHAFKLDLDRVLAHPNLIHPTALVLTPQLTGVAKKVTQFPWLRKYKFIYAESIEEAKVKLRALHNQEEKLRR
jgi:hypothetical protein